MSSAEKGLGGKSKKRSTPAKKKKTTKHKPRRTTIEHGEDGSHVIRHSFDQGGDGSEPTPDSVHGASDSDALLAHMQDQFGGQLPGAGAGPGPAAAGPGAAAAPPAAMQAAG